MANFFNLYVLPIVSTVVAIFLTLYLTSDITSDLVLSTVCGTSDIEVSDFYNRIRAGQAMKPLSDDIVIVNVDTVYDRSDLASLIVAMDQGKPKIIGLDLLFEDSKEENGDINLIQALSHGSKLVVGQRYEAIQQSVNNDFVSDNYPEVTRGIVNLTTKNRHGVVREFTPFFGNDKTYPSLTAAMLKEISPKSYQILSKQKGDILIRYQPEEYIILEPSDIQRDPETVNNKIVLVGTITDETDLHLTPLSDDFPGVLIHVNILSMMLHDDYVDSRSTIYTYLLGILSALILTFAYVRLNTTQNLAVRVIPIIWMVVMIYLGCYLFNKWGIYINAPQTILISSLALVILDLWTAIKTFIIRENPHKSKLTHLQHEN